MVRWDYVTTVESDSEPGVTYDIKRRYGDGHLGCACKGYRFAPRSNKACKHIRALQDGVATSAQLHGDGGHHVRVTVKTETYTFTRRAISFDDELPIRRGA